ncbi:MAG TPA: dihydropteroate synthase [Streptosporangiaceae bacterium]|nr:dihydropteroate synthase [Streptosporangiaceae bacterium]
MGVVNVTPDSFSDGGLWFSADDAISHGLELAASGADIVDVGGESTRPGAARITEDEELRRVRPVIAALAQAGIVVSIDTTRATVAEFALGCGAKLVNDVSGGLADPAMANLIASSQVPYVVMHWRGQSADMQSRASYTDVVAEVAAELAMRIIALTDAGVDPGRLIVDPGLGFGKLPVHNWALLARLAEISALACPGTPFPILVGASRKRFIGRLLGAGADAPRPFEQCDDATVALTALAAITGAWCVRVHSVPANLDAVKVAARWQQELIK